MCAARASPTTNTSSSSSRTTTMRVALNVSSAVGRLTGLFPPGCFPTTPQQLKTSTHILLFTTELCSLFAGTHTLDHFLRYIHVQLVTATGRPLRNANNALCALRYTPRLTSATAAHLFGSCGVAPAIANGLLPQAVCIERPCSSSGGGADPSNVTPNTTNTSSSFSPDPAAPPASSPDVTSSGPATDSAESQKGGGKRRGSTEVTPADAGPCKGGGKRPGCVPSADSVAPCKGGGKRPGFVGRNQLSNVVIGPLCSLCSDAAVNPQDSK
jgi:hypothetical protein